MLLRTFLMHWNAASTALSCCPYVALKSDTENKEPCEFSNQVFLLSILKWMLIYACKQDAAVTSLSDIHGSLPPKDLKSCERRTCYEFELRLRIRQSQSRYRKYRHSSPRCTDTCFLSLRFCFVNLMVAVRTACF